MATFKEISDSDIKTTRSFLNQLVDIIQEDISGSNTRRAYQVFVTGGVGPGVTSSLFQTVYDQDFALQTANPVFDLTVGIFSGSAIVASSSTGTDSTGKLLFPSESLMMREKISNYRQFAQLLLGNADSQFSAPFSNATSADMINSGMFVGIKRLFARDMIKRESFAMKFYTSASHSPRSGGDTTETEKPNLHQTSESGSAIFTDVGAAANLEVSFGGEVGNIVNAVNTAESVGVMFYQQGIAVFDMAKIISGSQHVSGTISAMNESSPQGVGYGKTIIGSDTIGLSANKRAKFIPDLMVSGSIDDIINHLASCRFSSGSNTAMTFQNLTNINSTLIFCRATADEFNYSSNPTYVDSSDNRIRVIEKGQEATQKAFSFVTTVGLYDANDNLLAVAKLSRPIEKNNEKDITVRVRLDF
ncbi:hypothetical protein CL622_06280 [archaeon]|nr:hypothetical protein [archaeon]